jgi:hypothetical protein
LEIIIPFRCPLSRRISGFNLNFARCTVQPQCTHVRDIQTDRRPADIMMSISALCMHAKRGYWHHDVFFLFLSTVHVTYLSSFTFARDSGVPARTFELLMRRVNFYCILAIINSLFVLAVYTILLLVFCVDLQAKKISEIHEFLMNIEF